MRIVAGRLSRDAVVSGALLAVALATFIGAVYTAIVVGGGAAFGADIPNTGLSVLATTVVAVTFGRVRERARRAVKRLLYGARATPYEVLSQFSDRVARTYATGEVLPRMARLVADGTGAVSVDVWLRVGSELVRAASWPRAGESPPARRPLAGSDLPPFADADRAIAVREGGELLGALAVVKRPGDAVTKTEEDLLADIASQAGLVLRNVRLTAELAARLEEISAQAAQLRASRQRIVAAQDAERRRLERDIHDGAQQHLVALAVKARMTKTLAERDPAKARVTLAQLRAVCDEALSTLRGLSHGIYPPVLTQRGIAPALRAQARTTELPVRVEARGIGRFPPAVEAAVYFVCLEALQNAAKHARASRVVVRLGESGGALAFSVTDDGIGFDQGVTMPGAGLQNMADRLAVLDGSLEVRSTPGGGTGVLGSVPLARRAVT